MANLFCGIFVLLVLLAFAPLAAFVPRAAVSGIIVLTAFRLINVPEIARIWRGTRGDSAIMVGTLAATLLLPLEFAVLAGIMISFARFILKTSLPTVEVVLPNPAFNRLMPRPGQPHCPQLGIIDVRGDLYFGAVSRVEDVIRENMQANPEQRYLLLRLRSVNQCDISGIHMLETVVRLYEEKNGKVFFMWVQEEVRLFMATTGFVEQIGPEQFLDEGTAVSQIFYKTLDPAVCIYECEARVFKECQNLPKPSIDLDFPLHETIPPNSVPHVTAEALWQELHQDKDKRPPLLIDVREAREFRQGHVPDSTLIPLSKLLANAPTLPIDRRLVFICRSGRRSLRAAYALQEQGYADVRILQGGIQAWEAAGLLEAVEINHWRQENGHENILTEFGD